MLLSSPCRNSGDFISFILHPFRCHLPSGEKGKSGADRDIAVAHPIVSDYLDLAYSFPSLSRAVPLPILSYFVGVFVGIDLSTYQYLSSGLIRVVT